MTKLDTRPTARGIPIHEPPERRGEDSVARVGRVIGIRRRPLREVVRCLARRPPRATLAAKPELNAAEPVRVISAQLYASAPLGYP